MRKIIHKTASYLLCLIMALTVFSMPAYAADGDETPPAEEPAVSQEEADDAAASEEAAAEEETVQAAGTAAEEEPVVDALAAKGTKITGSFDAYSGQDIATIRYYTKSNKSEFAFAQFEYNEVSGKYDYEFSAPYDGFNAVQGTSRDDKNATVIAEYFSTVKWDGAVDVTWYDPALKSYSIGTPAELAGVAAIVNGSINTSTPIWMVKGERADYTARYTSDMTETADKKGLPASIENEYYKNTDLIAGVTGEAYKGLAKNDFADKTITLTADLDMGGVDGAQIDQKKNYSAADFTGQNAYDYPNWTPIGGEYLMDPAESSTMIIAMFNGNLDGGGHHVKNLYCFRWSYARPGDTGYTAYGYAQGTGLVGMMGSLYDGEENPSVMPGVRNMSLSGYIFGRRMVGGFVGCMGGGSSAATGTSVPGGVRLENLANHASVYATDSKGLGGIVACSMCVGNIINCYNDGYLDGINYDNIPTGGIAGSNEGMNIYCCYNAGTLNTHGTQHGRGIGGDNHGADYTVSDCYYLEGAGDDLNYPGYYTYNLAESVSISTTELSGKNMTDGTLLEKLNANGTAYVEGDGGRPVLYWEKHSGTGSLTIVNPEEGGTISAPQTGTIANGTIVYPQSEAEKGWKFRYYTLNGQRLTGGYVTVNGDANLSGVFEAVKPGSLNIQPSDVCDITVTKTGIIKVDGVPQEVKDYPVNSGDPLFEGDKLTVTATLKAGVEPEDVNKVYRAAAGLENAFEYSYTYTGKEPKTTKGRTFDVDASISGDDVTLTLSVEALTTYKLWRFEGDTSWYNETDTEFTLTKPEQLAGLASLVYDYQDPDDPDNEEAHYVFEGKTIKLGNDISLKNADGTGGRRFWDGIGTSTNYFAGTFDGQGHEVTDLDGSTRGLFGYCYGADADHKAVIKNVTVRGIATGNDACGIAARTNNAVIRDCTSYCEVEGTGHAAGIVAYARANSTIDSCMNYAGVTGKDYVGGIVGELVAGSTITGCVNQGYVECRDTGGNNLGGIAGSISGTLEKCANYGHVLGYGRTIGGIAGQSVSQKASVTDCYNVGNVEYKRGTSAYDAVGGIIGFGSFFKITNCYNYGSIHYDPDGLPTKHIGAVVGREERKSTSSSSAAYYLDTACPYAEDSVKQEDLPDASYCKGMTKASADAFADPDKVLAAINGNGSFSLAEGGVYPEFAVVSSMHKHSGGTATCSKLARCDACGVAYGDYDKSGHGKTVLKNVSEPVWTTNGYTGNICCEDCGDIITRGEVIPADTTQEAITIHYERNGEPEQSKTYTVAQFDALKTIAPAAAYSYGGTKTPYTIEVATQYVTIEKILSLRGLDFSHVDKVIVVAASASSTLTPDVLTSCNKYFESGKTYDAPAAIEIAYGAGTGTMAKIAGSAHQSNSLRFTYGLSQEQFDKGDDLGGRRMLSPVKSVTIVLNERGDTCLKAADALKVKTATLPIKRKQSIDAGKNLRKLAGDAVASVSSSNTKVVAVSGVKITGKKTGAARVTVKMKSGAAISYTVKVQKTAVTGTIKLGCAAKVTMKKGGKLSIGATKSPVTCTDALKYSSSNKNIAAVSGKGVITAKKKGTATITVKCGTKKKTIKVKVK